MAAHPLPARAEGTACPLRFDRHELAGAFGDLGTDLPLVVGMVAAAGLDAASVLVMFGAMQILTGIAYRMPMPVQPLKAVAVLVITQKLAPNIICGAGLAIGAVMLALALTGLLQWLAGAVPKCVVRGIQFGLGVQLVSLAFTNYVRSDGGWGYALAGAAFVLALILAGNRRMPAALAVIGLGLAYALLFHADRLAGSSAFGFALPQLRVPALLDIWTGFWVLALPQIPLSLGNSILATRQVAVDLFPDRPIAVRRLGVTYSLMNLLSPFCGGIPVCHGSGGMAGHYAFGGRTGGSVVIYGTFFALAGLFLSAGFEQFSQLFPLPVLGVLLLFEGWTMLALVRDTAGAKNEFMIALLVGLMAGGLPYGYVVGLLAGTALFYLTRGGRLRLGHLNS
ncbi:MAG TPA: putative sulfate/molybdate transporter [Candidatus Paceibacterota bacterium]|nr:putative sulfate/molybdate transporter [Verrucomicrobiota bacterium]HRZ44834.1 putative sulfate/molybdate transporter [Candidatus Paceibacterota bacterium]HRZ93474.1 putative sulfate/molybdate transporter [Candidatus Paceibacterota bacterium]